jgi:hypothetical protein
MARGLTDEMLADALQRLIVQIEDNMEYYKEQATTPVTRKQVDKILIAAFTNLRDQLYG